MDNQFQHYYLRYRLVGKERENEYTTLSTFTNANEAEDFLREKVRRSVKQEVVIFECYPVGKIQMKPKRVITL